VADGEKAGVLARAVVVDGARWASVLLAALEVVLRRLSLREQAAHGRDLGRLSPVGGACDGDLGIGQIGPRADERQRLNRLRTRAEEADEPRIACDGDQLAVPKGNRVDTVARLDGASPADGYADRVDGEKARGLMRKGHALRRACRALRAAAKGEGKAG